MAALTTCAPAPRSIAILRRPSPGARPRYLAFTTPIAHIHHAHLHSRLKEEVRLQVKKNRFGLVFASNRDSNDTKSSSDASGPPFLTILAGVLVFLLVCWIIGSIVMWIVGLIVHPPPLK